MLCIPFHHTPVSPLQWNHSLELNEFSSAFSHFFYKDHQTGLVGVRLGKLILSVFRHACGPNNLIFVQTLQYCASFNWLEEKQSYTWWCWGRFTVFQGLNSGFCTIMQIFTIMHMLRHLSTLPFPFFFEMGRGCLAGAVLGSHFPAVYRGLCGAWVQFHASCMQIISYCPLSCLSISLFPFLFRCIKSDV